MLQNHVCISIVGYGIGLLPHYDSSAASGVSFKMRYLTPLDSWFLSAFQSSEFAAYLLKIWLIDTILLKQTSSPQHWLHALEIWNLLERNLQTTLHKGLVLIPQLWRRESKKDRAYEFSCQLLQSWKKKHDADLKFSHSLVLLQKNHLPTISAMPAAAFKPRSLISSCCLYPKPCSKRQVDHHRTSEKKLRQREHGHGLALSQFFLRQLQHRAHLPFANFSRRVPEPLSARWPSLQLPLLMAASMGRQSLDILGSSWQWGICKSKARTAPAEGELKKSPTDHLKFKNNCMKLEWISEIPPATYSCIFISTPQVIVLQASDFMVNPTRPLGIKIGNYQVLSQHLLQLGLFAAFNIELAPWMMIAEIVGVNNTTIFTTIPAKLMATFLGFNLSSTQSLCSTNAEP